MSNLITSAQGVAHITPRMDAHWHRKIVSESNFIFSGSFEMEIVSNNEVSIAEGVGSLQGRFFDVETGTLDSVEIANGETGMSRIDTICYKITNNILEGRQFGEWTVVQGEAVTSNPTAPVITEGDLDSGDTEAFFPIANVNITNFQITSISMIADVIADIKTLSEDYIVDQGTDENGWNYRKWASGYAEVWGMFTINCAVTTTSATYGGYRSNEVASPNFPFTFTSTPVVSANIHTGSQGVWVNNLGGTNANHVGIYLSSGASNSATNRTFHLTARGYWK